MILFANDWAKYPRAIVDTQTTNQSFVRLASVYRAMGVKNHAFILALHNPDLQGIDPHRTDLSLETKALIALECQENPWYFFREIARAPAASGDDVIPIEGNRANICLWWCFFNHVQIVLIQPRQTGKSFSTDQLMSLLLNVVCTGTTIHLMTKNDNLRQENVKRLKDIMDTLPPYLSLRSKDDVSNTESVSVLARKNHYKTHVPQSSIKAALNQGRGLTTPIIHIDEGPFQTNIQKALPAALPSLGAAADRAKAAGAPYGTIMTTTAGSKDSIEGAFFYELLSEAAVWSEAFFDCKNEEELRKVIKGAGKNVYRVNATFNHRQLGKTDEWLLQKIQDSLQKGQDAERDFLNIWTSGNEVHPLTRQQLERIVASRMPDPYNEIDSKYAYVTRWYIPREEITEYMANNPCIISLDTSEASGGDDCGMVITNTLTGEVVAAGSYNDTNILVFCEWFCNNVIMRFKNTVAVIEKRSTGVAVIDYLLRVLPILGEDPFRRLYNKIVQEADENPERFAEIRQPMHRRAENIYTRYKREFGFATSATGLSSRSELYGATLEFAARTNGDGVRDQMLINQITTLTIRNGRVDHQVNAHDDMVIGWLLGNWMLTKANNVNFYGLDARSFLRAKKTEVLGSEYEQRARFEQMQIRQDIQTTIEELNNCDDEFVSMKLEQKLKVLDKKLVLEDGDMYNLDSVLQAVREKKKRTSRPNYSQNTPFSQYDDNYYQTANYHTSSFNGSWR